VLEDTTHTRVHTCMHTHARPQNTHTHTCTLSLSQILFSLDVPGPCVAGTHWPATWKASEAVQEAHCSREVNLNSREER
jgi:hypothetical protein